MQTITILFVLAVVSSRPLRAEPCQCSAAPPSVGSQFHDQCPVIRNFDWWMRGDGYVKHAMYGDKEYFLLVKPVKANQRQCFEVVAVLPFPYKYVTFQMPVGDQVLLIHDPGACSLDGVRLDEIIALAQPGPQRPFTVFFRAWRVQSTPPYFVQIETKGMRCNTCIEGECD